MTDDIDRLTAVLGKYAAAVDRDARFPQESLCALRDADLLGFLVPKRYGGREESLATFVEAVSKLAGGCVSTAMIWAMHCQQVDVLVRHATADLATRVLPAVASGATYLASVTTEKATGGVMMNAHAPIDVVDGHLVFDRDAPIVTGGAYADGFLITLRSTRTAGDHQVSLVYADRADLVTEETSQWDALGMRGTHSVGMRLRGRLPSSNLVGGAGKFHQIAADSMTPMAHLGWSACWLGAARARFAEVVTWLRRPERRGGPDVHSDLVRERLACIRLDLEAVHAYLIRAVDEVVAQRASGAPQTPVEQIHLNALKLLASEVTFRAVDRMIALTGLATGYLSQSVIPLERTFRDLRSAALNISNERLLTETGSLALLDRKITLL